MPRPSRETAAQRRPASRCRSPAPTRSPPSATSDPGNAGTSSGRVLGFAIVPRHALEDVREVLARDDRVAFCIDSGDLGDRAKCAAWNVLRAGCFRVQPRAISLHIYAGLECRQSEEHEKCSGQKMTSSGRKLTSFAAARLRSPTRRFFRTLSTISAARMLSTNESSRDTGGSAAAAARLRRCRDFE